MKLRTNHEKPRLNMSRPVAAGIAGMLVLGGSGATLVIEKAVESYHAFDEQRDLTKFGLSKDSEALAKIMEEHGSITKLVIKPGFRNMTEVAKEIGAKDINGLANQMQVQLGEYMHTGDVVVYANDQVVDSPHQHKG